jgi:DNA polymerase (family 10)
MKPAARSPQGLEINRLVISIFNNIAAILEIKDVPFKPQAYRRAAKSIESLSVLGQDLRDYIKKGKEELMTIPGVGQHLAEKIIEIASTGRLRYYEKLKAQSKIDFDSLSSIPGLGPKKLKVLCQKLGIKNLRDLESAIKKQKIRSLSGFGERSEQLIREGIELSKHRSQRIPYVRAAKLASKLLSWLSSLPSVVKIEVAGSFRRKKSTIGDLDILIISSDPQEVISRFLHFSLFQKIIACGQTRCSILLNDGFQVDLRIVKEKEYGSALLYFTGNKNHNIRLRKIAQGKGYLLNEYGLFRKKDKSWIAGRTEKEIYKKLGLPFPQPEEREE